MGAGKISNAGTQKFVLYRGGLLIRVQARSGFECEYDRTVLWTTINELPCQSDPPVSKSIQQG